MQTINFFHCWKFILCSNIYYILYIHILYILVFINAKDFSEVIFLKISLWWILYQKLDKKGLLQYQRENFTIESILYAKWKIKYFHFLDAYQKILSSIFYISIEILSRNHFVNSYLYALFISPIICNCI